MRNPTALISGASIAGPATACWLARYGFDVTVVEQAGEVRPGGQAVDFKGDTHRTVVTRMGILDEVLAHRTHGNGDGAIVNAAGRRIGTVPAAFSQGEIEIPRGDLARILYARSADSCEYLFGDSVTAVTQHSDGVDVEFRQAPPRRFDLVIGADGVHSNIRRLAFGPESDYVTHLGHYYALAGIDTGNADEMYNEPGRMAAIGGIKAPAFFVFAAPLLDIDRTDTEQQKRVLLHAYRDAGWRVPELLAKVPAAQEFYLDSICRVTTDRYSSGRVGLVGDAAYGNTLGGFGTGLAIVGAYVLAGELSRSPQDPAAAFTRYQTKFRRYARVSQKVNAGKLLAPRTRSAIWVRNRMFSVAGIFSGLMKLSDRFATDIELEDYGLAPLHS